MRKILPNNRIIWIVAIIAAILIPVFAKYRDMRRASPEITLLVLEGLYLSEHRMFNAADKTAMIKTVKNFSNLSNKSKESFIGVLQDVR